MTWIDNHAKYYARESIYPEQQILHCMEALYKKVKNKSEVHRIIKSILIICANNNEPNLPIRFINEIKYKDGKAELKQ